MADSLVQVYRYLLIKDSTNHFKCIDILMVIRFVRQQFLKHFTRLTSFMVNRTFEIEYINTLTEIINKYYYQWKNHIIDPSDLNTEMELMTNLVGLSRLIENVMRTAIEAGQGIRDNNYYTVLKDSFGEGSGLNQEGFDLFVIAKRISDGLVHSNFEKVYKKTEELYNHAVWKLELHQKGFSPDRLFTTTFTEKGTILDIRTGQATDSEGTPVPAEQLLPRKSDEITKSYSIYVRTGCFLYTYDVLLLSFKKAIIYRDEIMNP